MAFAVLGPLDVRRDGQPVSLGGSKPRALLAMLLLNANEVVSRDRLIEGLWGESLPVSAAHSLDHYISTLRRALGEDRVVRQRPGYLVRVEPDELDLERFDRLIEQARNLAATGDPQAAVESLRAGLALFRGPPLADLVSEPFASREIDRLEERRLTTLEERVAVDLELGRAGELVAELERVVDDHPLRERLRGHLMVAYYRAGRQAAALETYSVGRRMLIDELGLEPGVELRTLEGQILNHDPALSMATTQPTPPAAPRHHRRRLAALVAAVIAAVSVTAVALSTGGSNANVLASASSSRIVGVTIGSPGKELSAALSGPPTAVAVVGDHVWVAEGGDTVLKVDPATGAVIDRIAVPGQPGALVGGDGAVWVLSTIDGDVERINPGTDAVTQTIRIGQDPSSAIAFDDGQVWVADTTARTLVAIDASTGAVARTVSLNVRPTSLLAVGGALWVADYDGDTVSEVNVASGQVVATVDVGNGPDALAVVDRAIWVSNGLDSTVSRIDPQTAAVIATIPVGSGPSALASASGSLWVASQYAGTLTQIDPDLNAIAATTSIGGQPEAMAADGSVLWTGAGPDADSHRGGTITLASASPQRTADPAFYSGVGNPEFTGLLYDTLVTFDDTSGPNGLHLVPDLAVSVPSPTDVGKTYTFTLRRGIHYSTGQVVEAGDFRRSLERLFAVHSPGVQDYSALRGAAACLRSPTTCDLAHGVVTDDRDDTVTFHLTRPDPDFLFKLADFAFSAPLPPGVPTHNAGLTPLPGTGPYEIASSTPTQVVFARNPAFREWSHAAQPAGKPDRIIWQVTASHRQSVRMVLSGRADWTFDALSPQELHAVRTRTPARLHSNPLYAAEFLPLNTHIAPFNSVLARRALNLAVDRRRIVKMYGGAFAAEPACQPLVPGLIGYRRYCPYTRHPASDGAYRGPNLALARRLVARSGTRGDRIVLRGATNEIVVPRKETAYIGRVLRSLGYRVRVEVIPVSRLNTPHLRKDQVVTDGDWLPSYPEPSSYLPAFFSCGGADSNGYVCNHHLDREMSTAVADQADHPRRAARAWRRIDQQITRQAYWVPTVAERFIDLTSSRVHNYQFSPVWGFIPDQAWVTR